MLAINEIHEGDCLDLMPEIDDTSIDMILCDLPYGITACDWDVPIDLDALWIQYKRIIKSHGAVVLFGSQPFTSKLVMSNLKWFKYEWIWEKTVFSNPLMANKQPMKKHENILVFSEKQSKYNPQFDKGRPYIDRVRPGGLQNQGCEGRMKLSINNQGSRFPGSVLFFSNPNNAVIHSTQKPVKLCEYLIRTYTDEGDLILDNCIGSGTTAIAAHNTGRCWIGIEQSAEYVEIARKRIKKETRQAALFV